MDKQKCEIFAVDDPIVFSSKVCTRRNAWLYFFIEKHFQYTLVMRNNWEQIWKDSQIHYHERYVVCFPYSDDLMAKLNTHTHTHTHSQACEVGHVTLILWFGCMLLSFEVEFAISYLDYYISWHYAQWHQKAFSLFKMFECHLSKN